MYVAYLNSNDNRNFSPHIRAFDSLCTRLEGRKFHIGARQYEEEYLYKDGDDESIIRGLGFRAGETPIILTGWNGNHEKSLPVFRAWRDAVQPKGKVIVEVIDLYIDARKNGKAPCWRFLRDIAAYSDADVYVFNTDESGKTGEIDSCGGKLKASDSSPTPAEEHVFFGI